MALHRRSLCSLLLATLAACGARTELALPDAPATNAPRAVLLAAAADGSCALRSDGRLLCWAGARGPAQLVAGPWDAVDLALGSVGLSRGDACAVLRSGAVRCVEVRTGAEHEVAGLADAARLTMGEGFACALRTSGRVACWGYNELGALGDGTLTSRERAADVAGLEGVVEVSAGDFGACARLRDGHVRCWGRAFAGQLGDDASHGDCRASEACSPVPVEVRGLDDAVALSAGLNYACALRRTGAVACWGWNYGGQLGDGTQRDRSTPSVVSGAGPVSVLRAGYTRTCVARDDGAVACWGLLATGPWTNAPAPTVLPGFGRAAQLAGGWYHLCALDELGVVRCASGGDHAADGVGPVVLEGL